MNRMMNHMMNTDESQDKDSILMTNATTGKKNGTQLNNDFAATALNETESVGKKDNCGVNFVKESSKVVISEVLTFVSEKLNYLPNDVVVQICTSFYDEKTLLKASEDLMKSVI